MEPTIFQEVTKQVTFVDGIVEQAIFNDTTETAVLFVEGRQGPAAADRFVSEYQASANLGGNRAVRLSSGELAYADSSAASTSHNTLGITTGAVAIGDEGTVQTFGTMTEPSWNWDLTKDIYLSTNGLLTQTAPTSGVVLKIGYPLTATSMFINIHSYVVL